MHEASLARRATAEASAPRSSSRSSSGSGIAAQRLSPDDVGLQLLENSIATGAGLVALILAFGVGVGRALQPARHDGRPDLSAGCATATPRVYVVAQVVGRVRRRDGRQPHVRPPRDRHLDQRPRVGRALARRGRRHLRAAADHPRRRARRSRVERRVRGRRLHRRGVLVHVVDELRQPGGHHRSHAERHVRRHRARGACPASSSRRSSARCSPIALALFLFPHIPAVDLVVPHDEST